MRVARLFPFLLLLHFSPLGHGQELPASSRSQPLLSKIALTAEENEVYGAFLDFRLSLNKEVINLSDRTFPIDLSGPDQQSCLKGLELINLAEARKRFHLLSAEVSNGRAVRRVDATQDEAKGGLLSLSEIAFDKRHQFAVLQFMFSCSPLCGQGGTGRTVVHAGTIVFEKVGDEWKQTERGCPSWFS